VTLFTVGVALQASDRRPADPPRPPPAKTATQPTNRSLPTPRAPDRAEVTRGVVLNYLRAWSLPNAQALAQLPSLYGERVRYDGTVRTRAAVMRDKTTFTRRWPVRRYSAEPGTIPVTCTARECTARTTIHWVAARADGSRRLEGYAVLTQRVRDGRIVAEDTRITRRVRQAPGRRGAAD
jgi:hypothetical protein